MKYFITSVRYNCTDPLKLGFAKVENGEIYIDPKDNSKWKTMTMLDFGWGKEWGMYRLPELSMSELFNIIFSYNKGKNKFLTDDDYNFYGSLASLINRFPNDLLNEIENKLLSGDLNPEIIKFLKIEFDCTDDVISRLSDNKQKELMLKWKQIKDKYDLK